MDFSPGIIINISENIFYHKCDTDEGYSGSPIILSSDKRVIGIHKFSIESENMNYATQFIKQIPH